MPDRRRRITTRPTAEESPLGRLALREGFCPRSGQAECRSGKELDNLKATIRHRCGINPGSRGLTCLSSRGQDLDLMSKQAGQSAKKAQNNLRFVRPQLGPLPNEPRVGVIGSETLGLSRRCHKENKAKQGIARGGRGRSACPGAFPPCLPHRPQPKDRHAGLPGIHALVRAGPISGRSQWRGNPGAGQG